jgi:adenylate cyclase class 2
MEEIEVKFLDIDSDKIEKTLSSLGAHKIYDRIFKDRVFDFLGWPLDAKASWLRLRDKGDKITLSFKKRLGVVKGRDDKGMEEVEIVVNDFEETSKLLESIGMIQKFNEEKRRIHFGLDEVDIDIDTWPMIPTYLEIEGKNWQEVKDVAQKMGLKWENNKKMSGMQVYELYGIREKDYSIITFDKQIKREIKK